MSKRSLRRKSIPVSAAKEEAADKGTALLQFSFKLLDDTNSEFSLDICDEDYLRCLLKSIQTYSNYTVEQFKNFNHESDRCTIGPELLRKQMRGKMHDEQLEDSEAWELRLGPKNTSWRAHGLLIFNVFYIIWLDPGHKLFRSNHPRHKQEKARDGVR
jgi:hypothetical protein